MARIRKLIWDDWNTNHLKKHKVTPTEAEEACRNKPLLIDGKKGRIIALGETNKKQPIAVVLDPDPELEVYYPVTSRPASRKERRLYAAVKNAYDQST